MAVNTSLVTWSSQALTAGTVTGSTAVDLTGFSGAAIVLGITTTTGGTSPTIQPNLQFSVDGVNWAAAPAGIWNGAALPAALALANGAAQYSFLTPATLALGLVRAVYTVVSTPTVTGYIQLLAH